MNKTEAEGIINKIIKDNQENIEDQLVFGHDITDLKIYSKIWDISWKDLEEHNVLTIEASFKPTPDYGTTVQNAQFLLDTDSSDNTSLITGGKYTFSEKFNLPKSVGDHVNRIMFEYFVDNLGKCPVQVLTELSGTIINVMAEKDFFKKYDSETLMHIYDLIGDDRILPKDVQDIFVF